MCGITGFISDAAYEQVLKDANVLCMTRIDSEYANYGFPFKIGEYLATGNPVLATRVSDLEKYLVHKQNVFFVEPSDVESIYEGLLYLIENPRAAEKIGTGGQAVWEQKFDPNIQSEQLMNFIKALKHVVIK